MEFFRERNGDLSKDRVIEGQVGAELAEEIETAEPKCKTTGILLKPKQQTARLSNRRRRIRVYLPR
jgi:hypothetical protein